MRKMKASEIVLDFDLYPRNNVDSGNVRTLIDAMIAGDELPPVVIDKKSKRCVDGFHRVRAHLRHLGEDAMIAVVEKTYRNDADMFLDAMRYNAHHGAKLDPCDRTRCTIIAERLSIPLDSVAGALHMPVEKLGKLHNTRTATGSGGLTIPLKRTNRHMAGKRLTKRQEAANEKSSGMNQVFYVNQVIDLIESKMLDMEDEGLLLRLRRLNELLEGMLVA